MTESEAQALAARLSRVWGGEVVENCSTDDVYKFVLHTPDAIEIYATFCIDGSWRGVTFCRFKEGSIREGQLEFGWHENRVNGDSFWHDEAAESFAQFAAQWLPFFRRGCWLSGCAIESSMHERMAWIEWAKWQGIERGELEAWQLTF